MTPEDDGPRTQKTVFRPSPLAAAQGAPPGPGAPGPPRAPAPQQPQYSPPPQASRPSSMTDDVPPIDAPMSVRNPLMAASARILALAAAVQAERQVTDAPALMRTASAETKAFEKTLTELGLSAEDNARARFATLATMDDIVQNLPGGAASDWARNSLVVQSFGQAFGGDQFWNILDAMLKRPAAHRDMLELYHACMAVGFQGRYRTVAGSQGLLTERMNAIYATLSDIRPRPEADLVPHWQGVPTPVRKVGFLIRLLIAAAALFAVLLLIFLGMKFFLDAKDEPAWLALRQLPPVNLASIDRVGGDVAAPQSDQLTRIRARLPNPCIEAKDDGATIRLVIAACPGLPAGMFDQGAANVSAAYRDLIVQAGTALKPEPGAIAIAAHTDSDAIRGSLAASYPDNLALSQARAEGVKALLGPVVGDATRLSAEGRGDREPADRADTPEAKAKNRRVELILPRSE